MQTWLGIPKDVAGTPISIRGQSTKNGGGPRKYKERTPAPSALGR